MSRAMVLAGLLSAIALAPLSAHALVFGEDLPIPFVKDIEIANGLAYVVSQERPPYASVPTLRILDLSGPGAPVEVGSLDTGTGAVDLEVVGGLAYITDRNQFGKLRIIDVSNPAAPFEIGAFASQFAPIDVKVVGNFAYLADQLYLPRSSCCGSAFRVIDVSNPAAPFQVSERFMYLTNGLEAAEGVVYITGWDLELVDVSNPAAPFTVGWVPDSYALDLSVAEGFLYTTRNVGIPDPVTGKLSGFEVFDVMDPANPIRVGRESAIGEVIELAGKLAYVAQPGMTVVDISDPTAPRRRGSIGSDSLKDVAVYGDHAYLAGAGGLDGLKVVDLSVLDTPAEVGAAAVAEFYPYDRPSDIAVSGGIAYLTVGDPSGSGSPSGSLRTFDVANPSEPVALASIDTAGAALDVELDAGLAYVAADRDGLRIFDVSEPSAPTAVGGLALPGSAAKVAVSGEIAYVVNRGIRLEEPIALRVLDISEPSAPIELGAVELADRRLFCRTPGLAVVDQLVYVNCAGLQVVDVSDPAHPVSIYTRPRIGSDSSIQVEDGLAYMVADGLLSVFDVSDPALPILLDTVYSAGDAAIVVQDGFAYSAGSRGLVVHDLSDPRAPVWLGGYPSDRGPWRGLAIADGLVFGAAGRDLQIIDLGPEYAHTLPVEIAIRADGASAGVNLASRGVIPVTVLGAADFDVANIERSTLRFGPGSATPAHPSGGHLADVNGDGHPDLVSHYWIGDSGISADDESACISGQTSAGKSFKGCGPLQATLPRGQSEITNVAD